MILQELRKQKKVTQQRLADALGVSRSAVAMWETGGNDPDADMLIRIAKYFGVSVDYLLGGEEPEPKPNTDDDLKVALFGGGEEVTDEMWEEVRRFAQYIKQTRGK